MQWRIKKIPEYFAEILQFDLSWVTILYPLSLSVDQDKEKLYEEAFLDIEVSDQRGHRTWRPVMEDIDTAPGQMRNYPGGDFDK